MSNEIIAFDSMSDEQKLEALISYAKQNPKKYELKKEALLKKYGFNTEPEIIQEKAEEELETVKELKKLKN